MWNIIILSINNPFSVSLMNYIKLLLLLLSYAIHFALIAGQIFSDTSFGSINIFLFCTRECNFMEVYYLPNDWIILMILVFLYSVHFKSY